MNYAQHTSGIDVEISGRVMIGWRESAGVTLVVFTESELLTRSTVSDNKTGDSGSWFRRRAIFNCGSRSETALGELWFPNSAANVRWADLGDRIAVPKIKLQHGLGFFCY
jgi:hypothetical protein